MDFSNLYDGLILVVCGMLVALYGARIVFPKLANAETSGPATMRAVLIIGIILVIAGLIEVIRNIA